MRLESKTCQDRILPIVASNKQKPFSTHDLVLATGLTGYLVQRTCRELITAKKIIRLNHNQVAALNYLPQRNDNIAVADVDDGMVIVKEAATKTGKTIDEFYRAIKQKRVKAAFAFCPKQGHAFWFVDPDTLIEKKPGDLRLSFGNPSDTGPITAKLTDLEGKLDRVLEILGKLL